VLGNLAEGTPEFLNIDEYVKALQALQDDTSCWDDGCSNFVHAMHGWSRLEQVFGKDGAKKALQDAYNAQKNSASTITIETAGYPEYGIQPMVVTMKIAPRVSRLGDLLVKEKVITSEQLEQATKFQKDTHTRLESALVKLGFLSDEDVTNFLSRQYGVPAINLSHLEIDPAVVKLIPYETAKRHQILPLSRVGPSLTIAMVNPTNVFTTDEIKFMTGFNIEPVVASESSIIEGIDKAYGTSKDGTRKVELVDLADGEEGV
jgi:hypothetical protein